MTTWYEVASTTVPQGELWAFGAGAYVEPGVAAHERLEDVLLSGMARPVSMTEPRELYRMRMHAERNDVAKIRATYDGSGSPTVRVSAYKPVREHVYSFETYHAAMLDGAPAPIEREPVITSDTHLVVEILADAADDADDLEVRVPFTAYCDRRDDVVQRWLA